MAKGGALKNITRDVFEPVWKRNSISSGEIGKHLGVSGQAVCHLARRLNLEPRPKGRIPCKTGDNKLFKRMYLAGVSNKEIAEHFGYAQPRCVIQRARYLGLPKRKRSKGTNNFGGWSTISMAEFNEQELGEMMIENRFGPGDERIAGRR